MQNFIQQFAFFPQIIRFYPQILQIDEVLTGQVFKLRLYVVGIMRSVWSILAWPNISYEELPSFLAC